MRSYQFELACFGESGGKIGIFESPDLPEFQVNGVFYIFDVSAGEKRANYT